MFTKNNNIKIKREIDEKINFYSYYIDCGFKRLLMRKNNFSGLLNA